MSAAVQNFKAALLNLPDKAFFEIIRNYLGPVKTPYNKHNLITRLVNLAEKNRGIIIQNIDEDDAEMLTAVSMLSDPDIKNIADFFSGERKYIEVFLHLVNLEERLLVYKKDDEGRYLINPVFREQLKDGVIHPGRFIKSAKLKKNIKLPPAMWLNPQVFFCILSVLFIQNSFKIQGGKVRKNIKDRLAAAVPALEKSLYGTDRIENTIKIIEYSGFLTTENDILKIRTDFFSEYNFSPGAFAVWLAGLFVLAASGDIVSAGEPQEVIGFITGILSFFPENREIDYTSFIKILRMTEGGKYAEKSAVIADALKEMGLIIENRKSWYLLNPDLPTWLSYYQSKGMVIISPSFELTIPPGLSPEKFLPLALISEAKKADIYSNFEINKQSVLRALNSGYEAEDIIAALEDVTHHSLPPNLKVSVEHWAEEFTQVSIYSGTVLALNSRLADIAEKSGILNKWIIRKISHGIFLMDSKAERAWKRALSGSGVEAVPDTITEKVNSPSIRNPGDVKNIKAPASFSSSSGKKGDPPLLKTEKKDGLKAKALKAGLSADEKTEIMARIEKKLIIIPDQIRKGLLPAEKTEAKGLNYLGKLRIIEQAVKAGNALLEIEENSKDGETEKSLLQPERMEKTENELYLIGQTLPDFSSRKIKVRKIRLVRKLKGSLYAP